MGAYLQITPALKYRLGYGEVRGCYYGPAGKVDRRCARSLTGEEFVCDIDLFDAETDRFPYADEYFSTVLCCELIEHLFADPMHLMAEVNRILKPGGAFVLTTPNIASLRALAAILEGYHPGFFPAYIRPSAEGETDARHNREYAPREMRMLLEDAGFEVTLLETGEFRDVPRPEHNWVLNLLERYTLSTELRGDGIYAVGRKRGPVRGAVSGLAVPMKIAYRQVEVAAQGGAIVIRMEMENRSKADWTAENFVIGWQLFDPETNRFIRDGEWTKLTETAKPGGSARIEMRIEFPPEAGGYHIYVSPLSPSSGWAYARGEKFVLIAAEVEERGVAVRQWEIASTRTLRLRNLRKILPDLFAHPFAANLAKPAADPFDGEA